MTLNVYIAYISPNGSTAAVAEALAHQLKKGGASVIVLDLSNRVETRSLIDKIKADENACLLVGSPVYRDLAVPPVTAFIDALPPSDNRWAVPFVTYGRACSGVALWQMATAMQDKGIRIAAAAKVVAVHSMMWHTENPEGKGHPDADDLQQVRRLAGGLLDQFATGAPTPLPLEALDYQPEARAREFKAKIGRPWMTVPKSVDEDACTECEICADDCPAGAIIMNPLPEFGTTCFDCFTCVRRCPENAIASAVPLVKIEVMIGERVKTINEQPLTQIFRPYRL